MDKISLIENLKKRGFSKQVIEAFEKVKREDFVPDKLVPFCYDDIPMHLEDGSTVSQPSTIAFMLDQLDLKQNNSVLEIGSGSGYVLSLISEIIKNGKVLGLERNQNLAIKSKKSLSKDSNIQIFNRDGYRGLPQFAPYDRIIVSASYPEIPYFLLSQLKESGIIVAPVKQSIMQIKKENGNIIEKTYPGFVFVPMVEGELL